MKKLTLALAISALFAGSPIFADSLTHCPLAADVQENGSPGQMHHYLGGTTEYNGETIPYESFVYHFKVPVEYFKEARIESTPGQPSYMKCVYIQKGGFPVELDPMYSGTHGIPVTRQTTGHPDGPWSHSECNSQNPADCMFYLK